MTVSPTLDFIMSPKVLEAAYGVAACAVIVALVEVALYLSRAYRAWRRDCPHEHASDFRSRQKPVIAFAVLFLGVGVSFGVLWILRHVENTGKELPIWHPVAAHFIALGVVLAVVGAFCWLRVTLSHRLSGFLWPVLVGICLSFPIWLAI